MNIELVAKIEEVLPQTQCTRCGFPSCHYYAVAISDDKAAINQCPPGGNEGIRTLAKLLNKPLLKLNPLHGEIKPQQVAVIDETACIGCALCIKACPIDAIIGANKMIHSVLSLECSGCDLCVPVCPVDCISMVDDSLAWDDARRKKAKERYLAHKKRQEDERKAREARLAQQAELLKRVTANTAKAPVEGSSGSVDKSDFIAKIMAKAQKKLGDE